jgi:integrase
VTAPRPARGAALLARLMAVVRPEFRADPLVFAPDDPVFGTGACLVEGCGRFARSKRLCQAHRLRWDAAGRPDLGSFAATTDPRWRDQQPNMACRIDSCRYGSARGGLCSLHAQRWERSGRPDLDSWLADPPQVKQPAAGALCRIGHCQLWPQAAQPFCHAHHNTWRANGRPEAEVFAGRFAQVAVPADEVVRLAELPAQVRLEIAYALQRRHDGRTSKTPPAVIMQVVRALAAEPVGSLLEVSEDQLRQRIYRSMPNARAFALYGRRCVEDLRDGDGWDAEYPRDIWQLRRLGFAGNLTLRFDGIPQPGLRALSKRWLRWRLSTGLHLETARRGLRSLTRFACFCDSIGVADLPGIDRLVLERYLADLRGQKIRQQAESDQIGQLNSFFHAIRIHRWDDRLPATAMFFTDDHPRRTCERPPRALAEQVMAQVEHSDNLAQWASPAYRLVTLILIRCGLRINDALRLRPDCLAADAEGAPYLRYVNHKMKREALVPIDEELRELIRGQQQTGASTAFLFPRPTKNPDGAAPTGSSTYRLALYRWLARCDVRDERGQPVRLTPHQWRHTLGTRLINRDVPQEVVRRILDHDSPLMTAHYARLHDTTIRRHWEAARKIDIAGNAVVVDPDGPIAEAAWAKQRLGRATQALPNGFCGLPVQQTCPHANACLTCPMFLTTAEFLPAHHEHRRQVLQIVSAAEARGHSRLAEMNQQVADNLTNIITALETDTADAEARADADAS